MRWIGPVALASTMMVAATPSANALGRVKLLNYVEDFATELDRDKAADACRSGPTLDSIALANPIGQDQHPHDGVIWNRKVSCAKLKVVDCAGEDKIVHLRRSGPQDDVEHEADRPYCGGGPLNGCDPVGSVVFGTGNDGAGFWNRVGELDVGGETYDGYNGIDLFDLLNQRGYTTIAEGWEGAENHFFCSLGATCDGVPVSDVVDATDFFKAKRSCIETLGESAWDGGPHDDPALCRQAGGVWQEDQVSFWSGSDGMRGVFCKSSSVYAALQSAAACVEPTDTGCFADPTDDPDRHPDETATTVAWHVALPDDRDAFCMVGQSGGSSRTLANLTYHGLDGIFDLVIPTGASPLADVTTPLLEMCQDGENCATIGRLATDYDQYLDAPAGPSTDPSSCKGRFNLRGICLDGGACAGAQFVADGSHCWLPSYWRRALLAWEASSTFPISHADPGGDLFDPANQRVDFDELYRNGSMLGPGTDHDYTDASTRVVFILGDQNSGLDPVSVYWPSRRILQLNPGRSVWHTVRKCHVLAEDGTYDLADCDHEIQQREEGMWLIYNHLVGRDLRAGLPYDEMSQFLYPLSPVEGGDVLRTTGYGCVDDRSF